MKPRILSVVGARPNFMKVAPLHRAFERWSAVVEHQIVHTGQHYDAAMSDAFFQDLSMPEPAYFLAAGGGSHAEQTAKIMLAFERVCLEARPALVLVVGDVNSTIACTLTAKKLGIPVAHVEAGLRSFDRTMPEELNRLATDALCDYAFVTEQSGVDNLLREGWQAETSASTDPQPAVSPMPRMPQMPQMFFVGNTMIDSLHHALPAAKAASVLDELALRERRYILATLHRPSNVDDKTQLAALLGVLRETAERHDLCVVFPVHPRTRKQIVEFGLQSDLQGETQNAAKTGERLILLEPQGYIRFLALMMNATLVLTDSGGVQEETTALGVPCLTLRTSTERPVTCTLGTNVLVQPNASAAQAAIELALEKKEGAEKLENLERLGKRDAVPPLWDGHAAERIAAVLVRILGVA
jgi:UDP-N-acetylglucosamine 2-epimerase (non-hydrolysing)